MNIFLLLVAAVLGSIYALWVMYLAVMALKKAREGGSLPVWANRLGMPLLMAGYLMDFLVNVFILSWLLLEPPKELLVTARLSRHIKADSGYRKVVATWICKNMLDFADPSGCHCR